MLVSQLLLASIFIILLFLAFHRVFYIIRFLLDPNIELKVFQHQVFKFCVVLFLCSSYVSFLIVMRINLAYFDIYISNYNPESIWSILQKIESYTENYLDHNNGIKLAAGSKDTMFEISSQAIQGLRQSLMGFTSQDVVIPVLSLNDCGLLKEIAHLYKNLEKLDSSWVVYLASYIYKKKVLIFAEIANHLISEKNVTPEQIFKILYFSSKVYVAFVNIKSQCVVFGIKDITLENIESLCIDSSILSLLFCKEMLDVVSILYDVENLDLDFFYKNSFSLEDVKIDEEGFYNLDEMFDNIKSN